MLIDRDMKKKDLCTVTGISFLVAPQQNKGGAFSITCSAFYGRRPVNKFAPPSLPSRPVCEPPLRRAGSKSAVDAVPRRSERRADGAAWHGILMIF